MFSFFRRQGKKQQGGGNSKKSKKQQGEFEYLNDIQCVPVERYQLDLSKPFNNENKAPSKPQLSPLIMGNSESTKKCSTESLDAGYQSDSPTKHNNNNVNSKNSEFRWESSTPHRIPSDSSNTTPSPPLNEVMTMLKNVGPRCDVSSLSRAKEIFLKTQAVSLTTSAPSNSINTSPQPPLAVPEDTDSCDSQTDVKSSYKGAHLDDTSTIRRINTENCDFSNRDSIRFADSDEGNVEDDERPKPVPYRQFSQSSSLCSNEDDDDAFQEAESKEDDSLSTHNNLQVPNITITESSDSEKEDDSDDDLQPEYYVMEQHYDRTYPTFLYDITEVEEPFSDASDVDASGYNDDSHR